MTTQFRRQNQPPLLGLAPIPNGPEPIAQGSTSPAKSFTDCTATQHIPAALKTATPVMSKSQKFKRVGLTPLPFGILRFLTTETDRSRLFRMEGQAELIKAIP